MRLSCTQGFTLSEPPFLHRFINWGFGLNLSSLDIFYLFSQYFWSEAKVAFSPQKRPSLWFCYHCLKILPEDPLLSPQSSSESKITALKHLESSDLKGSPLSCLCRSFSDAHRRGPGFIWFHFTGIPGVSTTAKVRNTSPNIDFFFFSLLFPIIPLCAGQCEDGEGNWSSWNRRGEGGDLQLRSSVLPWIH